MHQTWREASDYVPGPNGSAHLLRVHSMTLLASRRIFFEDDSKEWSTPPPSTLSSGALPNILLDARRQTRLDPEKFEPRLLHV